MEHVKEYCCRLSFFLHSPLYRVDSSLVRSLNNLDFRDEVQVWVDTEYDAPLLSLNSRLLPSLSRSMFVLSFDMISLVTMPL